MSRAPHFMGIRSGGYDVALKCRFDSIETDAVVSAAHEGKIFGVRPTQGHGRARRLPPPQFLLGYVGEPFHRGNKRLRIVPERELAVSALRQTGYRRPFVRSRRSCNDASPDLKANRP